MLIFYLTVLFSHKTGIYGTFHTTIGPLSTDEKLKLALTFAQAQPFFIHWIFTQHKCLKLCCHLFLIVECGQ